MNTSRVYFINLRSSYQRNIFEKFKLLFQDSKLKKIISPHDLVAIKLHFGESGSTGFIQPIWVQKVVTLVKDSQAKPFLTDTTTLYAGQRSNAIDSIVNAIHHGFSYSTVEAPIIIADGLRGNISKKVKIDQKHFKEVYLAEGIYHSDAIICLSHFKGHMLGGFGGSIKNLAMGMSDKHGKQIMHADQTPKISEDKCLGCGICIKWCQAKALSIIDEKISLDSKQCVGCGQCIASCPAQVFEVNWHALSSTLVQERMGEYALGVLKEKKDKVGFINFLINVTPDCDCCPHSDTPVISDIGILASLDPVAIDQVSVDLVNQEVGLRNSVLKENIKANTDKFKLIHPHVNWETQLSYGEKIGLGSRNYQLIQID
ncbi:DUF362 domain-containing protein [bacterium]|nr:DUF362 domain-containing protein [bacterium]MBU1782398.1 DUF362 domain-containing protein [bacterium]